MCYQPPLLHRWNRPLSRGSLKANLETISSPSHSITWSLDPARQRLLHHRRRQRGAPFVVNQDGYPYIPGRLLIRERRNAMLDGAIRGLLAMTITIHIPAPLRAYCEGAAQLALSAPSVRAALEQIERSHPALYRSVCDETGSVRRHVNVFVNTSNVRDREGLDTALAPGDTITIL